MKGITLLFLLISNTTIHAYADGVFHSSENSHIKQIVQKHENTFEQQHTCLAKAVYFEASPYYKSQRAVADAILNRVISKEYPHTVCDVIHQKTRNKTTGSISCQFSYICEGKKKIVKSSEKWQTSEQVAWEVLNEFISFARNDITRGATHFHDYRVNPIWARSAKFVRTLKTSKLSFYKKRGE